MAIRLKVQDTNVKLKICDGDAVKFHFDSSGGVMPPTYSGEYEVTPTEETQVLETAQKLMARNVTVNPIPNNYGLITWNGSVLTVS